MHRSQAQDEIPDIRYSSGVACKTAHISQTMYRYVQCIRTCACVCIIHTRARNLVSCFEVDLGLAEYFRRLLLCRRLFVQFLRLWNCRLHSFGSCAGRPLNFEVFLYRHIRAARVVTLYRQCYAGLQRVNSATWNVT